MNISIYEHKSRDGEDENLFIRMEHNDSLPKTINDFFLVIAKDNDLIRALKSHFRVPSRIIIYKTR